MSPALLRTSPVAAEQIHSPGATTSGFGRPSRVGPFDDVHDTPKTCGASRCVEPTVMQVAAWPGSVIDARTPTDCLDDWAERVWPLLPAEMTTTTPDALSSSIRWHSGESPAA